MPVARVAPDLDMHYLVDDFTDPWKNAPYLILQHGFGRSGTRRALRRHFEVDRHYVAVAALNAFHAEREKILLADDGWFTVAGLHFLNPGDNKFGSDPLNDVVLDYPDVKYSVFYGKRL